ncbi:MULTI-COPPER OXIDASE [Salix viminalis]|uniref:MULTI-COPPER OXIDASE n=1 Tax=Salix viminalis TaxID=40686 RepID=A0A9Q0NYR6_SALVM|nr:MULTI-COPPER OXIDASE [Salix viminalis]
MGNAVLLHFLCGVLAVLSASLVNADDPYRYYTWTVTYGTVKLLDVPQQVILINGQFPGPRLDVVTNDNIILNLFNKLDQPFLLTWWVVFLLSLRSLNESSPGLTTTLSSFFSFFDMMNFGGINCICIALGV